MDTRARWLRAEVRRGAPMGNLWACLCDPENDPYAYPNRLIQPPPRITVDDHALIEWAKENENARRYSGNGKQITDAGARALAVSCVFLEEIGLANTQVTGVGVQALANSCSNLTRINLNFCAQVTDMGVQALSRCDDLRRIELRNTLVSDMGVRDLADGCANLRYIDLNGTVVTVDAMQYMKRKLRKLTINVSGRAGRVDRGVSKHSISVPVLPCSR